MYSGASTVYIALTQISELCGVWHLKKMIESTFKQHLNMLVNLNTALHTILVIINIIGKLYSLGLIEVHLIRFSIGL